MKERRLFAWAFVLIVLAVYAGALLAACQGRGGPQSASGDTNFTNLDLSGTLNYGSQNLYPIGNTASNKEFAFGLVATPVQKATVPASVHGLATVTAVDCVPQRPALSGAWSCMAEVGASNQITLTLLEFDATPVPTASYGGIRWTAAGN